MIRRIRNFVLACAMIVTIGGGALATVPAVASAAETCNNSGFFTFPAWYNGLTDGNCSIKSPDAVGGISNFIWIVVLNVINIIFQAIGYIAFIMILYGGFRLLTSSGNASGVEQGKKTITNAIIGLIIAISAVAIDNLLFGIVAGQKNAYGIATGSATDVLKNALNTFYFLTGAVAVIVIIWAGIQYATSAGNASGLTKAKNTLIYAIIGLVVVVCAFAITNFVMGKF